MKIACFLIEQWQKEILENELKEFDLQIFSEPLSEDNIQNAKDAEIIISRARFLNLKFDKKTLEKFSNLKLIATMSTGFDHIDLNYCKSKNILISNVPVYGGVSVAEQVFALLLTISKKIPQCFEAAKSNLAEQDNLRGFDLNEKTLGVVGSGKIGLGVIKIAKAFGMKILAYDIFENKEAAEKLNFEYVSLEKILKESDIITLHTFLDKSTFHLLNSERFSLMKNNAVILNTARGELIDTSALFNYLKSNPKSFAGLDVIEGEGNSENKSIGELQKLPNAILTPHNASNTHEAKQRILQTTIENVKSFVNGNAINLVD